jgi:hypothetical protein
MYQSPVPFFVSRTLDANVRDTDHEVPPDVAATKNNGIHSGMEASDFDLKIQQKEGR